MPAETQPALAQSSKARFDAAFQEQERLRATLSPEEFAADRAEKWARFNRTCEEMSRNARANGLTDEILAELLADE
jgi:hypothetical protein